MLVFRNQRRDVAPRARLCALLQRVAAAPAQPTHDELVSWLIDAGELEAGLADALLPDCDAPRHLIAACSAITASAADAVRASWHGAMDAARGAAIERLRERLSRCLSRALPERIALPVSEGYAYYGLTPEQYLDAATRVAAHARPERAYVIGIRSIGTSLAAIVRSAFSGLGIACDGCSVRPRGHPFARRLVLAPALEAIWRAHGQDLFVVADEGPGLSGSSFASVVSALLEMGVPIDRIVLLPSAMVDPSRLVSDEARAIWPRVARITSSFEDVWVTSGRVMAIPGRELRDVGAGAWRAQAFPATEAYPAVQPQHERRKYRLTSGPWLKWAGLGAYGAAARARAAQTASWRLTPEPLAWGSGFLVFPNIDGVPLRPADRPPELLPTLADYLARIAQDCRADDDRETRRALVDMLRANVGEGLGSTWQAQADTLADRFADDGVLRQRGIVVRTDGRLLPHEWLRTAHGLIKTDGFEHGDDHFYPGVVDIAWDVAAACVEWRMTAAEEAVFLHDYRVRSGDVHILERVACFRAAYLAARLGYASLAVCALEGTAAAADAQRFAAARDEYARLLRQALVVIPRHSDESSAHRTPQTLQARAAGSYSAAAGHRTPA